jgi:hypothetical protein
VNQFLDPGWSEALKHRRIDKAGAQRGDADVLREVFGAKGKGKSNQCKLAGLVTHQFSHVIAISGDDCAGRAASSSPI